MEEQLGVWGQWLRDGVGERRKAASEAQVDEINSLMLDGASWIHEALIVMPREDLDYLDRDLNQIQEGKKAPVLVAEAIGVIREVIAVHKLSRRNRNLNAERDRKKFMQILEEKKPETKGLRQFIRELYNLPPDSEES